MFELGFDRLIRHALRKVRSNHARRNDGDAQFVASLLSQPLGDGANGELRPGINRHVRHSFEAGYGRDVDEMPESLRAKHRQRCGDAVEHAFDVDVDHLLPVLDTQVVERGNGHHASVVDEHVEFPVPLARQLDQSGQIIATFDVGRCVGCLTSGSHDPIGQRRKPIRPARTKDDLGASFGEQERCCLADAAARARDGDDLVFGS